MISRGSTSPMAGCDWLHPAEVDRLLAVCCMLHSHIRADLHLR
ncbi:unnamed protein product [Ectocarpus sp. 6 AP-2014]